MPHRDRFALVELVTVLAILAVLAALALPAMRVRELTAKRAELPLVVEGIRQAEIAYMATYGDYLAGAGSGGGPSPVFRVGGPSAVPWVMTPVFQDLGFAPDGDVRGTYWILATDETIDPLCGVGPWTCLAEACPIGWSDLDADGSVAAHGGPLPARTTSLTPDDCY